MGNTATGLIGTTVLALASLCTAGCRDRGADDDVDDGGGSAGTADDGGADDDGGSDGDDGTPPLSCEGASPGRVGLQRLTRDEYNRTVADLFDVVSNPADAFPPDSSTEGFDNNADSLTVSPQLTALLLDAADTVSAIAMVKHGDTIVACDPATTASCAEDTVRALALRVYRRPPSAAEVDDLLTLVELAQDEGESFPDAIQYALSAMLVAPQFLYRSVPPEDASPLGPGEIAALSDYALATRLSYFLWGSTPDDALLAAAGEGTLTDPDGLRQQFDRMLADDKATALYDGFATQWLQLGRLGAAWPDPVAFPQFDDELRAQMLAETRLFFEDIVRGDRSPLDLLTSNQTYANAELAALYGVDGVTGDALQPIETDATQRAGILTMPGVLTMLSNPQTPNIVRRGVWMAETILCAAPPPPPEGLEPSPEPEPGQTERERLEQHRADPNCASCHNLIDPLGFAFENYDAMGAWRTVDIDGSPVDNLGELPDGTTFNGVVEMSQALANGDTFGRCLATKLMTYSLGRTVLPDDQCTVDAIATDSVTAEAGFSDLLWAVVRSDAFLFEQAAEGQ